MPKRSIARASPNGWTALAHHRGNDLIPLTLSRELEGPIELGTVLESLAQRGDGSFTCSLRRGSTSITAAASHVLIAMPFTMLREVRLDLPLPEVKRRAIQELGYGTNEKLMVGFLEQVLAHAAPLEWQRDDVAALPSDLGDQPRTGRAGFLTNFTGGAHGLELATGPAEEQARQLVADLDKVFPLEQVRAGLHGRRMRVR